jgi:glutamate---cysteine ligase / carboxylate-amine ligase
MIPGPSLTIGIEEEYQIINPETRQLTSYITQFLDGESTILRERQIKPELHQSMVELGSNVCRDITEARAEIIKMRTMINDLAGEKGLAIVASGTHPLSHWIDQEVTPMERYLGVLEDMQELARQLLIFGMHVHIGIEDPEFVIDVMNVSRYMLPHILALTTSSPFWEGRNTGLKSYRSVIFRRFPRTGIPSTFGSYSEYDRFVQMLVRTGSIPNASKIWWDARPHHAYPTLEFRVADLCTTIDEALCIAAILQALVLKLWKMRRNNTTFRVYPPALIDENKWRAVRYGIDGKLIDFGRGQELPARQLIHELVEFVDDSLDELGCRREVEYAYQILEHGTSADRQLRVYKETGSLEAIVDYLKVETMKGCYNDEGSPNI